MWILLQIFCRLPQCALGSSRDITVRTDFTGAARGRKEGTSFLSSSWARCNCWQPPDWLKMCVGSLPAVSALQKTRTTLIGFPSYITWADIEALIWSADTAYSNPIHILCVRWLSEVPGQHIPLYAYTVGYIATFCRGVCLTANR